MYDMYREDEVLADDEVLAEISTKYDIPKNLQISSN